MNGMLKELENDNTAKIKRRVNTAFILAFVLLILFPVFLINHDKNSISVAEQRVLVNFPPGSEVVTKGFSQFRTDFTSGLQDRVGLRNVFVGVAGATKLYTLRQSPNDIARIGKDGWYFYTGDHNIEIGTGAYKFTDEWLSMIDENQQVMSNYFQKKGAVYFFMPSPAKPSIYPEYLPGDYQVQNTVIDQVTDSLQNNTEVNVIAVKDYLVKNKGLGRLYLKQDFHWDTLGSYLAYEQIIQEMNKVGVLDNAKPISMNIQGKNYGRGEVSNYFGGILPNEYAPDVVWDAHATEITSGEEYEQLKSLCEKGFLEGHRLLDRNFTVYKNPSAEGGTLLIYGDSQMVNERKIPAYLAEHFKLVVNVGGTPNIYEALDDAVKPDVVVFQRSERYLSLLFTVPGA